MFVGVWEWGQLQLRRARGIGHSVIEHVGSIAPPCIATQTKGGVTADRDAKVDYTRRFLRGRQPL